MAVQVGPHDAQDGDDEQDGVGLRRRLRPLFRTLACSRPLAGQGGVRVPQFPYERR